MPTEVGSIIVRTYRPGFWIVESIEGHFYKVRKIATQGMKMRRMNKVEVISRDRTTDVLDGVRDIKERLEFERKKQEFREAQKTA